MTEIGKDVRKCGANPVPCSWRTPGES